VVAPCRAREPARRAAQEMSERVSVKKDTPSKA